MMEFGGTGEGRDGVRAGVACSEVALPHSSSRARWALNPEPDRTAEPDCTQPYAVPCNDETATTRHFLRLDRSSNPSVDRISMPSACLESSRSPIASSKTIEQSAESGQGQPVLLPVGRLFGPNDVFEGSNEDVQLICGFDQADPLRPKTRIRAPDLGVVTPKIASSRQLHGPPTIPICLGMTASRKIERRCFPNEP